MSFLHAGDPRPYTAEELELVKKFPIVQFDKKQGLTILPDGTSTEDRIIAGARLVKQANPSVTTLMYINGLINFPASRLHAVTEADPSLLLRNTKGERVNLVGKSGVYDVRNPVSARPSLRRAVRVLTLLPVAKRKCGPRSSPTLCTGWYRVQ